MQVKSGVDWTIFIEGLKDFRFAGLKGLKDQFLKSSFLKCFEHNFDLFEYFHGISGKNLTHSSLTECQLTSSSSIHSFLPLLHFGAQQLFFDLDISASINQFFSMAIHSVTYNRMVSVYPTNNAIDF